MHPQNAARNAQSAVALRKASSTRTPQSQEKPKEGECSVEFNQKKKN